MGKKELLNMLFSKYLTFQGKRFEKTKIRDKRRVQLYAKIHLTEEQKNEIDNFYLKNYGKKIPYDWHRLYQSFTGNFDKKYFPEFLLIPDFERKMNPRTYANVFEDKTIIKFLTLNTMVKTPKILISVVRGVIRNGIDELISYEDEHRILNKLEGVFFIKPATDSCSGEGCRVLNLKNGMDTLTNEKINDIILGYSGNYILQEKLKNSSLLSNLYENSINTFRVITYIWNQKVYHCPVTLRIGQGKSVVDNAHAGGMFIGITDDGTLCNVAYTEFQKKYEKHPDSGIEFKNYKIPQVSNIIESAKTLHAKIPQLGILSWDFTLNEKNEPVLIEVNVRGGSFWMPQMAHGCGLFGENTADILRFLAREDIVSKEII